MAAGLWLLPAILFAIAVNSFSQDILKERQKVAETKTKSSSGTPWLNGLPLVAYRSDDERFFSACSGHITTEGTITSPNYPNNYANGLKCLTWIKAPECYTISVTFKAFDLHGRISPSCVDDDKYCCSEDILWVMTDHIIREASFDSIVGFCGTDIKPGQIITSPTDQMILYFETKTSNHTGWEAEVDFGPIPGCTYVPPPAPPSQG